MSNLTVTEAEITTNNVWTTVEAAPAEGAISVFSYWIAGGGGNVAIQLRGSVNQVVLGETNGSGFVNTQRNIPNHCLFTLDPGEDLEARVRIGAAAGVFVRSAIMINRGALDMKNVLTATVVATASFADIVAGVPGKRIRVVGLQASSESGNHEFEFQFAGASEPMGNAGSVAGAGSQLVFAPFTVDGPEGAALQVRAPVGGGAFGIPRANYLLES